MVSQIDLLASFPALNNQAIPAGDAPDSKNTMDVFSGKSNDGRSVYLEQCDALAIAKDGWKYIPPNKGEPYAKLVGIETGNSPQPQLYNLGEDIGDKLNLAAQYPEKVKELGALLTQIESAKQ